MTLSPRDKTLTLIGILLAVFLGALDQTIVSTALPRIAEDLQGLSRYAWVATSYLLASTVLVPVYGKLADMLPRKRLETFAVVTFLLGSFLCGLSGEFGPLPLIGDGMNQLIAFRALQGIGGAGLFSLAFIVIADLYPARERGRYQGLVGATFGVASVLGPWIGGLLTDYGGALVTGVEGWRWVFYVNVPFGAVALWFIVRRMPRLEPQGERAPLDLLSAALLVGGLVPFVLALQLDRSTFPWTGATTLGFLAGGIALLVAFAYRSLRSRNPILDLTLFENRVFAFSNLALVFLGAAFLCTVIFLPLFMVNVVGVSATRAGVSIIPLSLGTVFGAIVSGQLVAWLGRYKPLMLIGASLLTVALWLLSTMPVDVSYLRVTLYMVLAGLGVGPSLPLYTLAIQNAVEPRKIGQATSASQFFRQIGGTVGAAVMGSVLAAGLAAAFQTAPLPAGAVAGAAQANAAADTARLRSTGGAGLSDAIRARALEAFAPIEAALRAGDGAAFEAALSEAALPAPARAGVEAAGAAALAADAATRAAVADRVHAQAVAAADEAAAAAERTVRTAFHDAITTIFRSLIVAVIAGGLATLFVPALELARGPAATEPAGA